MNVKEYRNKTNIEYIRSMLKRYHYQPVKETISDIAASSGIPVLCVYQLVGEEIGFTEEMNKSIENIKRFYNV